MNPLTFNKDLPKESSRIRLKFVEMSKNAPIFVWDDREEEELGSKDHQDVYDLLKEGEVILPFPAVRIYVHSNHFDAAGGVKYFKFWAVQDGRYLNVMCSWNGLHLVQFSNGEEVRSVPYGWQGNKGEMEELARGLFTSLCWFIRECRSPANFQAVVRPASAGRSVEWVKSREHRVLIHRGHPANSPKVVNGSVVKPGKDVQRRMAHTRRAHTRILRSPRWKNKRGQVISVRASWVGPDEWKTNGSIYKIERK